MRESARRGARCAAGITVDRLRTAIPVLKHHRTLFRRHEVLVGPLPELGRHAVHLDPGPYRDTRLPTGDAPD